MKLKIENLTRRLMLNQLAWKAMHVAQTDSENWKLWNSLSFQHLPG